MEYFNHDFKKYLKARSDRYNAHCEQKAQQQQEKFHYEQEIKQVYCEKFEKDRAQQLVIDQKQNELWDQSIKAHYEKQRQLKQAQREQQYLRDKKRESDRHYEEKQQALDNFYAQKEQENREFYQQQALNDQLNQQKK